MNTDYDKKIQEFFELAKNRNKYRVAKKLDGELNYAKVGDFFYSDTLYDREYNIPALIESGHLELVPRMFPFEKELVGKNHFSILTVCPECGSIGVNMPLEKTCGNCGYTETRTYYDAETIHYQLLNKDQNLEVCDATESDSSNKADNQINHQQ